MAGTISRIVGAEPTDSDVHRCGGMSTKQSVSAMRVDCLALVRTAQAGHICDKRATRERLTAMLSIDDLFKGRHFDREIIILCVRWYLRFKLSFRDLVEMMAERGYLWPMRQSCAESNAMFRNSKSGGTASLAKPADPGASMRPTSRSRVAGLIFTAPSTAPERPSISCSAPSEILWPPKRSSVGRSRSKVDCRRRSCSTAIKLRTERRVNFLRNTRAAHEPKFGRQNI
jgi:hypothetical protein